MTKNPESKKAEPTQPKRGRPVNPPRPVKKARGPSNADLERKLEAAKAQARELAIAEVNLHFARAMGTAVYNLIMEMSQYDIRAGMQINEVITNHLRAALLDAGVKHGRAIGMSEAARETDE